jgi:hypothetical protein
MSRIIMLAVAVVALTAGKANAQFTDITGWYGFTSTQSCLVTAFGFNSAGEPMGPSWVNSGTSKGTYHFLANGTGTQTIQSITIVAPGPAIPTPSAGVSTRTGPFHYIMGADGESFRLPGGGSFSGTLTTGPRAGETFTITNAPELTGWIGDGAKELTLTGTGATVEKETFSGPVTPLTQFRICETSEILIRLPHAP